MARKKEDEFYDTLAGASVGVLTWVTKVAVNVIWALLAVSITLIFKGLRVSPEDQLRDSQAPVPWGEVIEYVICSRCRTPNEKGSDLCCVCGVALGVPTAGQTRNSGRTGLLLAGTILLMVLAILAVVVIAGAS